MNVRGIMNMLVAFVVVLCMACAVDAQAQDKKEQSKPKQQQNIFCAERSTPERFLMVDQVNCETVCNETYKEYACDLKKLLAEGWKVTGVSSGAKTVKKPPCECKVTGTETTMEKE
jgi:hypothetical protein